MVLVDILREVSFEEQYGSDMSGSVERRNVDRLKKLTSERASVGGGGGGGERKVNKRTSARVKE